MAKKTLGDQLAMRSEEELAEWASEVLDNITKDCITALDIMGWRIVRKHNPKSLWPFSIDTRGLPSEHELAEWANGVVQDFTDEHAKALDVMGWMIQCKDEATRLWPFSTKESGCDCPIWCQDMDAPSGVPMPH